MERKTRRTFLKELSALTTSFFVSKPALAYDLVTESREDDIYLDYNYENVLGYESSNKDETVNLFQELNDRLVNKELDKANSEIVRQTPNSISLRRKIGNIIIFETYSPIDVLIFKTIAIENREVKMSVSTAENSGIVDYENCLAFHFEDLRNRHLQYIELVMGPNGDIVHFLLSSEYLKDFILKTKLSLNIFTKFEKNNDLTLNKTIGEKELGEFRKIVNGIIFAFLPKV